MPRYEVSQRHVFAGHATEIPAGGTIDLPEDEAKRLMQFEPGLLSPVRETTQETVEMVRTVPKPKGRPRAKR